MLVFKNSLVQRALKANLQSKCLRIAVGKYLNWKNYSTDKAIQLDGHVFKTYNIEECPNLNVTLTKEQATKYYEQMQTIRRMENAAGNLYKEKAIRGFCHLYSGQEAVAVGIRAAMRDSDNVITAYRCHGWCYVMGISTHGILAELTGRNTGVQRGKGGSMHMYCSKFFGGNGIVGAQAPLGAGVALACKYSGNGGVCFTCYGDGAANQGQLFESFNIACLWKLPCIFVCENNLYELILLKEAKSVIHNKFHLPTTSLMQLLGKISNLNFSIFIGMGTKVNRSSCNVEYYTRGDLIPGLWVDGMNILAVRNAAEFAINHALKNGPMVMEMHTYRYMGHSMSDPGVSYRSREEIQEVRKTRDPIMTFKDLCLSKGILTEAEIKVIDDKTNKDMNDVVEKSKVDKEIELKELTADIYSNNLEPKIRATTGYNFEHIQINKGVNH